MNNSPTLRDRNGQIGRRQNTYCLRFGCICQESWLFIVFQIVIPTPNLMLECGNMDLDLVKSAGSAAIHSEPPVELLVGAQVFKWFSLTADLVERPLKIQNDFIFFLLSYSQLDILEVKKQTLSTIFLFSNFSPHLVSKKEKKDLFHGQQCKEINTTHNFTGSRCTGSGPTTTTCLSHQVLKRSSSDADMTRLYYVCHLRLIYFLVGLINNTLIFIQGEHKWRYIDMKKKKPKHPNYGSHVALISSRCFTNGSTGNEPLVSLLVSI